MPPLLAVYVSVNLGSARQSHPVHMTQSVYLFIRDCKLVSFDEAVPAVCSASAWGASGRSVSNHTCTTTANPMVTFGARDTSHLRAMAGTGFSNASLKAASPSLAEYHMDQRYTLSTHVFKSCRAKLLAMTGTAYNAATTHTQGKCVHLTHLTANTRTQKNTRTPASSCCCAGLQYPPPSMMMLATTRNMGMARVGK